MVSRSFLSLLLLVLLISACTPAEGLPTQMALPDDEPAIEEQPTEVIIETETPTPRPTVRARPTLPPTWTPTPAELPSSTPEPVIPVFTPFEPQNTLPSACDMFRVDFENSDSNFPIGNSPRAAWTLIEGAELYRVTIGDDLGRILRDDIYVAENSYVFDASLFELGRFYAWSVYPINAAGDQMCFQSGFDLVPFQPLGS